MSSIAYFTFRNIPVEVIDYPYEQGGIKLVPIKALEGEPFADGSKTTTRTAYLTVKESDLQPVYQQEIKQSLLDMALAQERKQWPSGESVWLWGDRGRSGAYLKNDDCVITLNLVGYRKSLPIFILDLNKNKWIRSRNLEMKYQDWVRSYRKSRT